MTLLTSRRVIRVSTSIGTHDPQSATYDSLHNEHFAPQEDALRIGMLAELAAVYTILNSDF